MQAAILEKPGQFVLQERDVPSPGLGEILVRTQVCGICTSELDMWEGKAKKLTFPRFIGHEVSGTVAGLGKGVVGFREGDLVSVYSEGKGYAEYTVVPAEWAVKLGPNVPVDHALGEPIACSVNGVRKADPQIGDSVCLVGCGFMGLIMLQVFKVRGAGQIIAIDRRDSMLALARDLGATDTINPDQADAEQEVQSLTEGKGVDIGVEAGGSQQTLDLTTRLVRMEGKLEVFGFHQGERRLVDWGYWNWMAFQIINGHTRTQRIYVEGIRIGMHLIETGKLDMKPLVTHRFALADINEGFARASDKEAGFVKGIVSFSNGQGF